MPLLAASEQINTFRALPAYHLILQLLLLYFHGTYDLTCFQKQITSM